MASGNTLDKLEVAAGQHVKERDYWLEKLSAPPVKSHFPYDYKQTGLHELKLAEARFSFTGELFSKLMETANKSDIRLHIILAAGLTALLGKYTGDGDIITGMPIYKQDGDGDGEFINTVLALRNSVSDEITSRELLNRVRQTIAAAAENQDYPLEILLEQLNLPASVGGHDFPLFDTVILLENIHDKTYIKHIPVNMTFSFKRTAESIEAVVEYNSLLYRESTTKQIIAHLQRLLPGILNNLNLPLAMIEILSAAEKKQLLYDFNDTAVEFPAGKTIDELFEEQVEKTPQLPAVCAYLDLTGIYAELNLETLAQDLFTKFEKCCFKKNPYIFQFKDGAFLKGLNIFSEDQLDRLVLLRTHRDNYVAVNKVLLLLLDYFDGKANLLSIFKGVSEINKNLEFLLYSGILNESSSRLYDGKQTFPVSDGFGDMVLLIKALYNQNLIDLTGYGPGITRLDIRLDEELIETGPYPAVPLPSRRDKTKSPVLLLGDRTGCATTGLLYMASFLRRNGIEAYCQWNDSAHTKVLLKENLEQILEKTRPGLVGVSMKWFPHIARVLEICKMVKEYDPSIRVVVGGNTASYFKEEIIRYEWIDYVISGDGELPLLKICQGAGHIPNCTCKKDGEIIETPISYVQDETNSSDIYLSHLDKIFVLEKDPYLAPSFYINTGKGCSQQCFYCAGCRQVQEKTFNRARPFLRSINEVRKDIIEARKYTSRFMFDFDLPLYDSLDYYKKIWEGIDLSGHFCRFYFWMLPFAEFIELVVKTFKYVYLNIDLCSLSETHRLKLSSLKIVKQQPTDDQLFAFFDTCEKYDNVEVVINQITGLPYFTGEDITESRRTLSKILEKYSKLSAMDWGRLHAQPGAPIIETCREYDMYSYGRTFEDFLYYSRLNLEEETYPDLLTFHYPYIYANDDNLNSKISRYYFDEDTRVARKTAERRRNLKVTFNMTYEELNENSNRLAGLLKEKGVKPGTVVGIMANRSLEMITGILGILKAGGAYLPLDPGYPPERTAYILADSRCLLLLTQRNLLSRFEQINFTGVIIDLSAGESYKENSLLDKTAAPDRLAYVIYTSGSTGQPKGVMVDHGNVAALVKNTNYIDFTPGDRLLMTGSIVFDVTTFEIWWPLLNGVRLYLVEENIILDFEALEETLVENNISILHLIPQLFNQLALERPAIFAGLKYLMVGGDLVQPTYIDEVRQRYKDLEIVHMYGPTENTTFSTSFLVADRYEVSIPIGRPINNSSVYIVGPSGRPVPAGAVGELWTGGAGVARGYLNRPGLTGEKFLDNPFVQGDRVYRTGDMARWFPDGNIDFLGRMDQQVKVRGIRIEPGEIESRLLKHDHIKEAVVMVSGRSVYNARGGLSEDKYLCAYIVPNPAGAFDKSVSVSVAIKKYLSRSLPDYMIPLYTVVLAKIPLTANGKVDRKALPHPASAAGQGYTAPRDRLEEKMAELWSSVLGIKKETVGIDANFFDLGGHSLMLTVLIARIHKELEVKIPLAQVFKAPVIRALVEYIRNAAGESFSSIRPVEQRDYYRLSSAQKRLYVVQQKDPGSTGYNMPVAVTLTGGLEKARLKDSFNKLIERHESLRTSFHLLEEGPVQAIHDSAVFALQYHEEIGKGAGLEKTIRGFVTAFDLARAPLMRVGLIKVEKEKYILVVDVHHIISDGISHNILLQDFLSIYQSGGLPRLKLQYSDFSQWQNNLVESGQVKKQEEYWLDRFAGEVPLLDMPLDYPRPPVQESAGNSLFFQLEKQLTENIHSVISGSNTTLNILFLAVYNVLLAKYTGQKDITVGIVTAGRRHADLQNIIGFFVNMLAMRNRPEDDKTFKALLEEVRKNAIDGYENQDYQFEELVSKVAIRREPCRHPLVDTVFTLNDNRVPAGEQGEIREIKAGELVLKPYQFKNKIAHFDLMLSASVDRDSINVEFEYSTSLFNKSTIEEMSRCYAEILKQVVENRDILLKDIVVSHDFVAVKSNVLQSQQIDFGF